MISITHKWNQWTIQFNISDTRTHIHIQRLTYVIVNWIWDERLETDDSMRYEVNDEWKTNLSSVIAHVQCTCVTIRHKVLHTIILAFLMISIFYNLWKDTECHITMVLFEFEKALNENRKFCRSSVNKTKHQQHLWHLASQVKAR